MLRTRVYENKPQAACIQPNFPTKTRSLTPFQNGDATAGNKARERPLLAEEVGGRTDNMAEILLGGVQGVSGWGRGERGPPRG